MDARFAGPLVVLACLAVAVPWKLVLAGTDGAFLMFALAPPLLFALGAGWKNWALKRRVTG